MIREELADAIEDAAREATQRAFQNESSQEVLMQEAASYMAAETVTCCLRTAAKEATLSAFRIPEVGFGID